MTADTRPLLTSTHWGTYRVDVEDGRVTALRAFEHDPDPSAIGHGIIDVLDGPTRIHAPMIRNSWLEGGPGKKGALRGQDKFVQVSWEEANQLVATELNRVRDTYGNSAIFAGSYGWASAGRFHHAQSQLKRFLNLIGGFTSSRNTYSFAAAEVVVPHVLGSFREPLDTMTSWDSIASDCETFVAFGGVPLKNGQISQGGTGAHVQKQGLLDAHAAGVGFVNISPLQSDLLQDIEAEWLPIRPNTDVALMLALAFVLLDEGLHDQEFLEAYTEGFGPFATYLRGETDGIPKTPKWAAEITEIPAGQITALAQRMAATRTMISVSWSLTRQDHGEQPFWAAIALAAMLGQIGLPGTGIGFGYSAMNNSGLNRQQINYASLPQGQNPVSDFIPVARITEMLENPGGVFDYDGGSYYYPDIHLVWWAGGNPFHHHQDLNRLRRAWAKPDTIIANEWCWNALAQHADIVLPCTTPLERMDIALTPKDPFQVVMDQAIPPISQARDDHEILRGIAAEMGVEEAFTEGRSQAEWVQKLWDRSRDNAAQLGIHLPDWTTLQSEGWVQVPVPDAPTIMLEAFRRDPVGCPLATPSGKIELFSETIASFSYDDCPGHPTWMEPVEWLGCAEPGQVHLISNQPRNKLHSQLDHGAISRSDRPKGAEQVTLNPRDAEERGFMDGQILRLHNVRGGCLAELRVDERIRPGVAQIATGAWLELKGDTCQQGNPNTLTRDQGTSRLAQGPVAHSCLIWLEGTVR